MRIESCARNRRGLNSSTTVRPTGRTMVLLVVSAAPHTTRQTGKVMERKYAYLRLADYQTTAWVKRNRRGTTRLLAALGIVTCTGCSGLEIGTKAWISRVDERQESQATHRRSIPLKCYFTDCSSDTSSEEKGS